jgi:hypothetical protein
MAMDREKAMLDSIRGPMLLDGIGALLVRVAVVGGRASADERGAFAIIE